MKVKGGRKHYKKDRSNIIAVICATFSELVKAVKTSDTLFHSTIPLKIQWVC